MVSEPFEVAAPRVAEREVVVRGGAEIVRVAEVADARVAGGVILADFSGPVRRGVVADDEFEIVEALREYRADGDFEIGLAVVDGHTHADGGDTRAGFGCIFHRNLAAVT